MAGENVEPEITVTSPDSQDGNTSKSSSRLIVVSNRLPFVLKKSENSEMHRQARLVNYFLHSFKKFKYFLVIIK